MLSGIMHGVLLSMPQRFHNYYQYFCDLESNQCFHLACLSTCRQLQTILHPIPIYIIPYEIYLHRGKLTACNNNHLPLTDAATSHKEVPGSGNNHAASSKTPITSRSPFSPAPLTNAGSFASDP